MKLASRDARTFAIVSRRFRVAVAAWRRAFASSAAQSTSVCQSVVRSSLAEGGSQPWRSSSSRRRRVLLAQPGRLLLGGLDPLRGSALHVARVFVGAACPDELLVRPVDLLERGGDRHMLGMRGDQLGQRAAPFRELRQMRVRGRVHPHELRVRALGLREHRSGLGDRGVGIREGARPPPLGHGLDHLRAHWTRFAGHELGGEGVRAMRRADGFERGLALRHMATRAGDECLGAFGLGRKPQLLGDRSGGPGADIGQLHVRGIGPRERVAIAGRAGRRLGGRQRLRGNRGGFARGGAGRERIRKLSAERSRGLGQTQVTEQVGERVGGARGPARVFERGGRRARRRGRRRRVPATGRAVARRVPQAPPRASSVANASSASCCSWSSTARAASLAATRARSPMRWYTPRSSSRVNSSRRFAGSSCRNLAKSPCGSTTHFVKCANGRPNSCSTAGFISLTRAATTSVPPGICRSRSASALPLPSRTTRVAW